MMSFTVPESAQPVPTGLYSNMRVRQVRGLGLAAMILAGVDGLFGVAVNVWTTLQPGAVPGDALAPVLLATLGAGLMSLASAVVIIIWLYNVRKNVDAFVGAAPRWAAGWTIGAWFVPLASVVLLPLVIADVARNTFTEREPRQRAVATVWIWGGLQIAAVVVGGGLICIPFAGIGDELPVAVATVLIVLFSLGAAITQLLYIQLITAAQHQRIAPGAGATQAGWTAGQVLA
jgi:hypothetical protein